MKDRKAVYDKLGVVFSGLCLGHCLLTPAFVLLMGVGPVSSALGSEWPHIIFLVIALSLALLSLPKAWRQSRNPMILVLGLLGAASLSAGLLVHGELEVAFTLVGSVCLILAHLYSANSIGAKLVNSSTVVGG